MSKLFLCLFLVLMSVTSSSQEKYVDSLLNQLQKQQDDTNKVNTLNALSRYYIRNFQIPEARRFIEETKKLAVKTGYKKGIRDSYISMGGIYNAQANNFMSKHRYPEGLTNYLGALKIYEQHDYKAGIAGVSGNIGRVYWLRGDYKEATRYYRKALKIFEELGDNNGVGNLSNNIGLIYENQGLYPEALNYFDDAIKAYTLAGNRQALINLYFNLGFLYEDQGKYDEALNNHRIALGISEETSSRHGIAASYANLGDIYKKQGKFNEALKNYLNTLGIFEELNNNDGIALAHCDLGSVYLSLHDFPQAKLHLEKGLAVAKKDGYLYQIKVIYELMAKVDSAAGNWEGALNNYKQFIAYRDSIQGTEVENKLVKAQMQYEFEKQSDSLQYQQALTDERLKMQILLTDQQEQDLLFKENELVLLNNEKQLRLLQMEKDSAESAGHKAEVEKNQSKILLLSKEKTISDLELRRQRQLKTYLIGGLALFLILSFFVYRNYRNRQQLKLQLLRNKIASDLHDDIGSTLSSISIFSQMAQQQSKDVKPLLETIEENSRKMLDAMADIVWTVSSENDQFEKIILRMRSFAYELLGAKNIDFEFLSDDEVSEIKLPMHVRRNLYLIFKEATNNLVKYSNAGKAVFNIKGERNNLVMQIRDNGVGFDIQQMKEGNGLKNMKKRAEEIGAKFIIDSHPGKGTTIELKVAV